MLKKDNFHLLSIEDSLKKIFSYSSGFKSSDEFFSTKEFEACIMNFIVIGEMVTKLSVNLKETNRDINWDKVKEYKNIIAHNYFGIDAEEVWDIINNELNDFRSAIQAIIRELG